MYLCVTNINIHDQCACAQQSSVKLSWIQCDLLYIVMVGFLEIVVAIAHWRNNEKTKQRCQNWSKLRMQWKQGERERERERITKRIRMNCFFTCFTKNE